MKFEELMNSTVLIVDDSSTNLGMLFNYLGHYGFKIYMAQDGAAAIQIAKERKPDLILLDIVMPGINGFEVCEKLKGDSETADIPVIFMTALSDTVDKVKGFEAGAVDYIIKPLQNEEVLARVRAHLTIQSQQKSLAELNASKDRFFSIIAHDLRSPFMNIMGISELLAESMDEFTKEEVEELAKKSYKSVKNTFSLLENLLEWSRLQTNGIEFEPIKFDLFIIAESIFELYDANAKSKKITLEQGIKKGAECFADENMISTVLRNLVSNAIKFTTAGGTIKISSRKKAEFIEVTVTDTGVGIPKDTVENLFRIDVKHSTIGTANEKGVGLGLVLCKQLVERNGGELTVESELGEGSTFRFTIPKAKD